MPPTIDTDGAMFELLRPRLTAISRRIVGSQAEAEDVVQDCFLKWHGARQADVAAPAAWLTTVVRHQSIDRLRKRVREAAAALGTVEPASDAALAPAPEEALLLRAELGEALARLARLSPAERVALVLHEALECGHADIARLLDTTVVNARQHLARARRRLRAQQDAPRLEEQRCRELLRRFQAAINGADAPAMMSLLADEQPVSVLKAPRQRVRVQECANDAFYAMALAA